MSKTGLRSWSCLRMRSGRNFVGTDSKVNLISNVIQLHTHPKENSINILPIWIVHSTIPNQSPLSISRAHHRDLICVQNMTKTSLSLIWGVTVVVVLIFPVSNIFQIHWKHFLFFCTTDGVRVLQRCYSVYDTTNGRVGLAMTPNTTAETN